MNEATEAAKVLGSISSKKKARAARINGKKGGRPRKSKKAKAGNEEFNSIQKLGVRSKSIKKAVKV